MPSNNLRRSAEKSERNRKKRDNKNCFTLLLHGKMLSQRSGTVVHFK